MTGRQYIEESCITELSYNEAAECSRMELMKIVNGRDYWDEEVQITLADNPILPYNAELYDDFCDEYGFDCEEYTAWLWRTRPENRSCRE